jgi:hypothetical protein
MKNPKPKNTRLRLLVRASVGLMLFGLFSAITLLAFAEYNAGNSPAIWIYVVFGVGLGFVLLRLAAIQSENFSRLRADLKQDVSAGLASLQLEAGKLLSSKVEVKNGRDDLLDAISAVFSDAAVRSEALPSASKGYAPEVILLFGASSIQPKASDADSSGHPEGLQTPYDRFVLARQRAETEGIRFHRYVRLFDDKNFLGRSPEIREAYLIWLKEQIALMKRSPLYVLINARRAPRWKAIRSSIISNSSFIDILGDGESGFIVHGADFSSTQRANAQKYIDSTNGGRTAVIDRFSQDYGLGNLEGHLAEMTQLNDQGLTSAPEVSNEGSDGS